MTTNDLYTCLRCLKDKPRSAYRHKPTRAAICRKCDSRYSIAKRKLELLKEFDFVCQCCGEDNPYFLTLDHVNNDGAEHRRTKVSQTIYTIAKREGFDRSKWNCLCMNCNFAKGHYGKCPHEAGITSEMAFQELVNAVRPVGRGHVKLNPDSFFKAGFDERRMQLNRRNLKPCPFCGVEFGTHEMARHKRDKHADEMKAQRLECLALGRKPRVNGQRLECEVH